ncbi:MAG: sulfatase-like hydrolase/transferase [Verrucomicrobiales bacterium]
MKTIIAVILFCFCSVAQSAPRPNILLIFADDIGYEALNCYGGLDFETPNLNRMAANGLKFNRAYTSPVCTPSRVSLHTGLYTNRHGHYDVLPVHNGTKKIVDFQKMPTFAQQLRGNGYQTSVTGKWQLATLQHHPNHIRDAGFDSWCVWQIYLNGKKTDRHWNATFNHDGKLRDDIAERFGPDVLVEFVIARMREAKATNKPFLILHNELLPHWPVVETPDDRKLGREASLPNFIHYMDKLVGKLLDEVEALGIRDNTYVFFMGDNDTWEADFKNPKADQPGELPHTRHTTAGNVNGGKFELKDGGCHVPFLVWGPPAVPVGKACDDLVDVVDLFPTICELADTKIPATLSIDGRSLVPQIHGKPGIPRVWTHNALGKRHGGETLFDGNFRLFRDDGKLIDGRSLPLEKPAAENDPEAEKAKAALQAVFEKIQPSGPRPPLPFESAVK